jgi:iron complex outermembrane receptor protein
VGAKTDWLDKKLRVDVAVFRNDWTNLQVSQGITLPGLLTPVQQSSNAAAARSTGLDADVTFKPWDGWTFTSSVTWLPDAVYLNYTGGQASTYIKNLLIQRGDPRENAGFNVYNASGNRLQNAPDLSANITGQKDFDLGNGNTAFIRGEAAYTGNTYFDISDDPISRRNPFTLFNASVGWASPGGHYQVELWGRNIADKQYWNTISVGSLPIGIPGSPRTFGIQLNYTY